MNDLVQEFGDKLEVLAFPSNQFGHQENGDNDEILDCLKHIRPGNGYEPQFPVFQKIDVNGSTEHPFFKWLKEEAPTPSDDPTSFTDDPQKFIWSPVTRADISWNFEKFLIGKDGHVIKRYSPKFPTIDTRDDIEQAVNA